MSVGAIASRGSVEAAIRRAADRTGVDFEFLMATARRESALNPRARARTSSASGLYQFIDQTWLATLSRHGARHGYGAYAQHITRGADGRYRVSEAARQQVMDLRYDPQASAIMAAELASDHAAYLRGRTGIQPTSGDLYAAHFLGPEGSARLIEAARSRPTAIAASLFPQAAAANRPIFYREGRAATVAEVYANLTRQHGAGAAVSASRQTAPVLSDQERALAERLDRLRGQQQLLAMLTGQNDQQGLSAGSLLAAFGPGRREPGAGF